ncbi:MULTISPECIES: efflux RND transporter permease subunit [unclassified Wenzhouxiangella]|uniref:efflux RND transporter permease subunit n=1 Tax=unclassified Wenzhouxiangella TaxID=2613841 RepID=UPI000E329FA2|nr:MULTISPECIES: efflux RND transporter permease subunit [unclassified Wenzhouxiangella]RFF26645.1 efflux RND transporter permease subunit [Wenzhouxiangella sp. 15181]RFP67604.1 efflux RND transporter permease subunit [Wenzhouxiangella sp. 15190]
MIDRIISISLNNRLLVLAAAVFLLAWGTWVGLRSPMDVFPDLTAPSVTVVAEAHGMPPEDVERLVTFPIETAMNGASGVRRVRSNSGIGISVITVEFEWGTDIYRARQIVSEKLQGARSSLPADLPPPQLAPVTSIMGEVMFIALVSDEHDEMALKTVADWTVRRRLLAVPGVAEVIPNGGRTRQYQVVASPERLAAYGITLDQLSEAVGEASANASAGFMTENGQEFLIRGIGRAEGLEDIRRAVVLHRDEIPVLVQDVADVGIGPAPRRGSAAYNAHSAVVLGIQKQPDVNTLMLTERLDEVIADLGAALPDGMRIETDAFRQADFIEVAIDNLVVAVRDGAVLVVLIMFVFLFSLRATGIALLAIPLSLLVAVLGIRFVGGSINTMTLGGMAIALGALVDDAIIVVENIVRRLRENAQKPAEEGRGNLSVVFEATREIEASIVFATLIIILVFLPLFFLHGVEGRLLQPLGLAYVISLAASLLVAVTVTPVLALLGLPGSRAVHQDHDTRLISGLKRIYRPALGFAMDHWRLVIAAAATLLAASIIMLTMAGRGFLPEFNEGSLTLSVVTLPGTSLEQSDAIGRRVETILLEQPEVVATARRTGRAELDPHAQQVFASEIDVSLEMQEREKAELLAQLRSQFALLPGTNVIIGQPISHRIDHMLSGTRANIAIKIFGEDLAELRNLGSQVESRVAEVPGAVDVAMEEQSEIPFVSVRFDRLALANYGLSVQEASEALEGAMTGATVGRILEGQASHDLVVRFPESVRESLETIRQTALTLDSGARVPFAAIADIERDRGPNTIGRENVQRRMVVMANVAGRDLVGVVDDIRRALGESVELPPGYHIEYGGQFESAASAGTRLMFLGGAVIVGIFLLLVGAFGNARSAFIVMLNLPLALIGGVVGVWLTGGIMTIAALIGFIALFGIATRNGVILVDHIGRLRTDGLGLEEAIRRGAEERLVPILMTALATALALVPLALAAGEPGSEIQSPMAVVILWGLVSSTLLNMLVVPAVCRRFLPLDA